MPRAITKLTFKMLPASEQAALKGGIAAFNAVVAYKGKRAASTAAEITAAAFARCSELYAPNDTDDPLRASIKATAKSKGWSDAEIAAKEPRSYDLNFVAAVVQMGDVLEQLSEHKKLLERGGFFASLAATFNSHVRFEPARVTLSEKGIPEFDIGMRFKTALGLVAWTIIRLAQLRAHGHVVLRCAECREFKIVSIRKPQRFCSAGHRNLYNVHQHRLRAKAGRKHK